MGQKLYADESQPPPRSPIMELACDCPAPNCQAWNIYIGHDYIEMRAEASKDGWRRGDNKWLRGDHK